MKDKITVHNGDCLDVLASLPECSIDAVVTDPPYHFTSIVKRFGKEGSAPAQYGTDGAFARASRGFMGKEWDGGDIAFRPETWALVWRVLKPGGHMVAFGAPKNYHRLACAIEDAGFEIRDSLMWVFGTGFPKSLDVSKAIDKAAGAEREVVGVAGKSGSTRSCMAGDFAGGEYMETAPATDAAREWQGFGTALKPSYEPIVLARKPLSEGTVAANVLKWGTGAINIDACRVETSDKLGGGMVSMGRPKASEGWDRPWMHDKEVTEKKKIEAAKKVAEAEALGRWPANLCHDGSDEVVDLFPDAGNGWKRNYGGEDYIGKQYGGGVFGGGGYRGGSTYCDSGSAARFFYSAKASKADRAGSKHPTVKPVALMQWLVRMVTPPGGTVLDPFAGSGTTGQAAINEAVAAILIEREKEYYDDIMRRIA